METQTGISPNLRKRLLLPMRGERKGRPNDAAMIRFAKKHVRVIFLVSFFTTIVLIHAIIGEVRCVYSGATGQGLFRGERRIDPEAIIKDTFGLADETVHETKRELPHRIEPDWDDDEPVPAADELDKWEQGEGDEGDYEEYNESEEEIDRKEDIEKERGPEQMPDETEAGLARLNDISLGKEKYTDSIKGDQEEYFRKIDEYKPWIDPHTYRYKLNPKGICRRSKEDPRDIFLVIFVNTAPGNFLKRMYMRNTFGKETAWPLASNESMRMVFSIGATKDMRLQAQIYQESEMFGDIVQEDFIDHYWNMTLKSIMGFKWVTIYCQRATFVMKMDDDVLLNTPLIYKVLKDSPTINFTMGDVLKDLGPVRDKNSPYAKFYTPKHVYREDEYPPFYGGSSYIMSADVVEKTYYMALKTPLIPWSDVFIGICYHKVGLTPGHRHLFRQNARFKIAQDGEDFRVDDERLTYLKQHMSMYHLTITHSKQLWDIWTEDLCKMECVKPTPRPPKKYKLP